MDQTWIIQHSEVIDSRAICHAVEDLVNEHVDGDGENIPPAQWPTERQIEFKEYERIISEVKANAPSLEIDSSGDCVTLVSIDYFTEYVKDECLELYGNDLYAIRETFGLPKRIPSHELAKHLPQLEFVDWSAYADHMRQHFAEIDIDGITYLYEGC